ncbi:MAG: rubrerythrin family protein [Anaerolineales bacterium]|nr:rubrerythrin family protein [Anaerolineales bacterium]
MPKTTEDLKAAFAGESQANRRYLAFARKAAEDGHPQVARLFRAVAAAETVHALNHFKAQGEVKTTSENLQTAIAGENYEVVSMYPAFIADAEMEDEKKALTSFRWAWEVEKVHEVLYRQALEQLGQESAEFEYYVCPVCGYTHERNAPERCPVCGAPGKRFERIS